MVPSDRIDPVILGHILGHHRELHSRLLTLKAAYAEPGAAGPQRIDAVATLLAELREHLREHFEQEETGGFLEESIARMPRLSGAAGDVIADHPRLLAELDSLLESVGRRDTSAAGWSEASRGFAVFTDHLLAHERNENAVVQAGYNEDLGFGD
jgi:hypothetical protein